MLKLEKMHRFSHKNYAWKVKNSEDLDEFQFYLSQDKEGGPIAVTCEM